MSATTIQLAGRTIHIRVVKDLRDEEGNPADGIWHDEANGDGEIHIDEAIINSPRRVRETLIHEMLHAIESTAGIELGETKVTIFAALLEQALGAWFKPSLTMGHYYVTP